MLWDRRTLAAPRRAIVWQDRRSSAICDRLRDAGHEDRLRELTGLRFDPYFTGTKLTWLAENDERAWRGVTDGSTVVGTVDSYLVARLTGGARARHRRVQRLAHPALRHRPRRVERRALRAASACRAPRCPRWSRRAARSGGRRPSAFLGLDLPVAGIAGDQQAALFGQACYGVGESKCTYGTGSFVLVNTGPDVVRSEAGLLSTVAWRRRRES